MTSHQDRARSTVDAPRSRAVARPHVRVRATSGLTLMEMLVTVLVLTLMGGLLALGANFAARSYQQLMEHSEARALCSTLASVVGNELRYTEKIGVASVVNEDGSRDVTGIQSVEYAAVGQGGNELAAFDSEDGELVLRGSNDGTTVKLLSSSAYGEGAREMGATVEVTYDESFVPRGCYHVRLLVNDLNGVVLTRSEYDVIPANKPDFA